ncbi:MAG: M28 family peptidase [Promethearchaeota archaeon]
MKYESNNLSYFSTDFVENFSFPRLAGTKGEKKAQLIIEEELKRIGIDDYEKQDFTYTRFYMNVLLRIYDFIISFFVITLIFLLFFNLIYIALFISLALFILAWFSRQIRDFLKFKFQIGKKRQSANYIVKLSAEEKSSENNKNVIIFAHYDSISHSYHPFFSGVIFFLSLIGGTFFALHVFFTILIFHFSFISAIDVGNFFYGFFLAGFLSLHIFNSRHNQSSGTVDNATGVANSFYLIDYFKKFPLNNINLIFVLTGAEEMGDLGAYAYIKENFKNLRKKNSFFFIIDSIGANQKENLYFYAEGFPKKKFSCFIENSVKKLISGEKEGKYLLSQMFIPPLIHFSTDHAPLKHYNYEFAIFSSNGTIHSEKDNINNYYPKLLENFNEFMRDLIIFIDKNK